MVCKNAWWNKKNYIWLKGVYFIFVSSASDARGILVKIWTFWKVAKLRGSWLKVSVAEEHYQFKSQETSATSLKTERKTWNENFKKERWRRNIISLNLKRLLPATSLKTKRKTWNEGKKKEIDTWEDKRHQQSGREQNKFQSLMTMMIFDDNDDFW